MSDDVGHVLGVLQINPLSCAQSFDRHGIENVGDLVDSRAEIEEGKLQLKHVQKRKLLLFCDWYEEREESTGGSPNVVADFTPETYNELRNKGKVKHKIHFKSDDGATEDNCEDSEFNLETSTLLKLFVICAQDPEALGKTFERVDSSKLAAKFAKDIEDRIPEHLKEACNFDYMDVVERTVEHLLNVILCPSLDSVTPAPFLVNGRTQTGKSAFKALLCFVGQMIQVPAVILTKGVDPCRDLNEKINDLLQGYGDTSVKTPVGKKQRNEMSDCLKAGGTLVVPDTVAKVTLAHEAIDGYRSNKYGKDSDDTSDINENNKKRKHFMLIIDECDDYLRTPDKKQKFEQALQNLMKFGQPALKVMISATLVPNIMELHQNNTDIGHFFKIEPRGDEYLSIDDMKILTRDGSSEKVFLEHGELKWTGDENGIPYCSPKCEILYDNALSMQHVKGVLLLDISSPRVKAPGNIFQKAEEVQAYYAEYFTKIIVIAYCGSKLGYKISTKNDWVCAREGRSSKITFQSLLEELDEKYGLETPVFVFGFAMMKRCISFRSNRRVPTHILNALGKGHSIESMIQAIGRATFKGKDSVLRQNGFSSVVLLTEARDYDSARAYYRFTDHVVRRVNNGESLRSIMDQKKFPWLINFINGQKRKVGKDGNCVVLNNDRFDDLPDALEDAQVVSYYSGHYHVELKYKNDEQYKVHGKVMGVMEDCTKTRATGSKTRVEIEPDEIQDAFEEKHQEAITKKDLRKILTKLCNDGKIGMRRGKKTLSKREREMYGPWVASGNEVYWVNGSSSPPKGSARETEM